MSVEVNGFLVAAHELKAPLCLMRQLTLALALAPDFATQSRLQRQLVEVSDRALREVEDLTKISRLEDGLFDLEPVSVRGVCDEVMRELAPLFGFSQKTLGLSYHNKSRLAVANRDLLRSIVYNFCVNALRYSENGTCSQLSISDHTDKIRIGVRDFGPALPTRIWRELQSGRLAAPASIAMRPGSSGLGLFIASEFAYYMHSKIGAVRHRDGTSFFVDLPVSQQMSLI